VKKIRIQGSIGVAVQHLLTRFAHHANPGVSIRITRYYIFPLIGGQLIKSQFLIGQAIAFQLAEKSVAVATDVVDCHPSASYLLISQGFFYSIAGWQKFIHDRRDF
jgi:hypothetical protein